MPAEYYKFIYLLLVVIFTSNALNTFQIDKYNPKSKSTAKIICAVFIILLGTRPYSDIFVDMGLYYNYLYGYNGDNSNFAFDWNAENLIFDNIETFCAYIGLDPLLHFLLFATIYFGCILTACNKMFPKHSLIAFICYCGAFSTFSYCVNGYKAGSAAAIFLVALAYRDNLKISVPMALLSWGFHHSMQLPLAVFLITHFYNRPKFFYYLWYVCAIISLLHISLFQTLFAGYSDERGASYLSIDRRGEDWGGGGTGFRFDFWLYSSVPVIVGWRAINKFKIQDVFYNRILCMYLVTNSVWLLCIYAPYNNRIAYLSWFMYPIVLLYPFFNDQFGTLGTVYIKNTVWYHLAFTLFMAFIYA